MVFTGALDAQKRAYIAYLSRDKKIATSEIMKKTGVSRATIYRIKKEGLGKRKTTSKKNVGGRPRKLNARHERNILRTLKALRHDEGNFSSNRLMKRAGIVSSEVSSRTVRRCLNQHGYRYLQSRKKGLMSSLDLRKRVTFAKNMKKQYPEDIWTSGISFYLDGVGFYFKTHPADQARAPRGRIWRTKSEGLKRGCTAKGSKEGSGGKVLKILVAFSYGKGVIECYPYEKMDGPSFASFVNDRFDSMFDKAQRRGQRLFVQDNDPAQNCASVRKALRLKKATQLKIPPRSPDLNPIENMFKRVKDILREQALERNIERETFTEFSERVIQTLYNFSIPEIDKTIMSMNKRINLIISSKGERIKY